jgi:hypothetical protein
VSDTRAAADTPDPAAVRSDAAAVHGATKPAAVSPPAAVSAPAEEPPLPRPATWTVRVPEVAWCPAAHAERVLAELPPPVAVRFRARLAASTGADGAPSASAADGSGVHLRAGAWTCTGGTRRGRRKAHGAEWGEDAHFVSITPHRGVMVVADGAGSASWSRLGSAIAVDVVGDALTHASTVSAEAMHDAVQRVFDALHRIARAMEVAPRTLRTTLLAVAWEPNGTRHRLVTTQVGDGSLVLMHANGTIERPAAGDGGEWSGEVHCFLPDDETMTRARAATVVHDVPDLAALLLVTDGIDDPFYPFVKHAGAILGQLVHGATAPLQGLATQDPSPSLSASTDPVATLHAWLGFEKRGENDDRTLAVALHDSASLVIAPWAPSPSA